MKRITVVFPNGMDINLDAEITVPEELAGMTHRMLLVASCLHDELSARASKVIPFRRGPSAAS